MQSALDHITVVAPGLAAGIEHVRRALGVELQAGGVHPLMGTHNHLLKLGEALFLEVIAIDPGAPAPQRPRWFGLDRLEAGAVPRLATWVARTSDIEKAASASPVPVGNIEAATRGNLSWRITVPADGSMPLEGAAPTLIQWDSADHPGARLTEAGCSLVRLEVLHPQADRLSSMLDAIGFSGDVAVSALAEGSSPQLVAHIQTPAGIRILR